MYRFGSAKWLAKVVDDDARPSISVKICLVSQ